VGEAKGQWNHMTEDFYSLYRKKKLEEEEAEVKRKATDAAYQGKLDSCFFTLQRDVLLFFRTFGKYCVL